MTSFILSIGEQKDLPNSDVISLKAVTWDSRCPVDVLCVWTGMAIFELRWTTATQGITKYLGIYGDSGDTVVMGSTFDSSKPDKSYNDHKPGPLNMTKGSLSITKVLPPRKSGEVLNDKSYKVEFLYAQ